MFSPKSASITETGFAQFELSPALERGVAAAGFTTPRPIQEKAIPAALEGRDILGLAQTGTGKTAAFALPMAEHLLAERRPGPRALIVAPTRELASQIDAEFRLLTKFTSLKTALVYGGVSMQRQIDALRRKPDVVIACPGRLLDLYRQKAARLDGIEILVLDEADHMFDMGFLPDIRRILAALPKERQNLLFSATMPKEIRHLADAILRDPHVVELAHSKPAETIEHALYPVHEKSKVDLLKHLVAQEDFSSAIIFTRTKHRARRLAEQLGRLGHKAVALQGNMSQSQRDRAMKDFRTGRADILVATDIAARGIDVAGISHVINFDIPNTPDAYTHRIGRTGRAEKQGKACTFVAGEDRVMVRAIERKIGAAIPRIEVPGFQAPSFSEERAPQRNQSQHRNGGRSYDRPPQRHERGSYGRSSQRAGAGQERDSRGNSQNRAAESRSYGDGPREDRRGGQGGGGYGRGNTSGGRGRSGQQDRPGQGRPGGGRRRRRPAFRRDS